MGSGCHGLQIEWEARVRDAKHGYRKSRRQVRREVEKAEPDIARASKYEPEIHQSTFQASGYRGAR